MHGITPDDVAGAPHFSEPESQKRLQEAFSGATLVVHNARYRDSFLGQELDGYHAAKHTVLDTMNVSKFFGTGEDNTLRSFSESNGVEYKECSPRSTGFEHDCRCIVPVQQARRMR